MSLTGDRFQKTAGVAQLSRDGRDRLNAIPGVEDFRPPPAACPSKASSACLSPSSGGRSTPPKDEPGAGWMSASPDYYKLFKIPILRGREFNDSDTATSPHVMLINEALAKEFFPKQNPVGQQILIGHGVGPQFEEPARQIVGVVGDTHDGGLGRDPGAMMIVPAHRRSLTPSPRSMRESCRCVGQCAPTATRTMPSPPIAEQLRLASGGFPVTQVRTMDELVVPLHLARDASTCCC